MTRHSACNYLTFIAIQGHCILTYIIRGEGINPKSSFCHSNRTVCLARFDHYLEDWSRADKQTWVICRLSRRNHWGLTQSPHVPLASTQMGARRYSMRTYIVCLTLWFTQQAHNIAWYWGLIDNRSKYRSTSIRHWTNFVFLTSFLHHFFDVITMLFFRRHFDTILTSFLHHFLLKKMTKWRII